MKQYKKLFNETNWTKEPLVQVIPSMTKNILIIVYTEGEMIKFKKDSKYLSNFLLYLKKILSDHTSFILEVPKLVFGNSEYFSLDLEKIIKFFEKHYKIKDRTKYGIHNERVLYVKK